jgi:hypothetical protein
VYNSLPTFRFDPELDPIDFHIKPLKNEIIIKKLGGIKYPAV